ncbi:MAG: flagellar hook-associated protein FlgL [Halanaerobiales bacterium]
MRVTNGVMKDNYMRNLSNNLERIDIFNQQLSTGKKFQNPSQNPVGVTNSLSMKNVLATNDQYLENAEEARSWLSNTEIVLKNQGQILQRVREQVVYASNGSLSTSDKQAIKEEIAELKDELINLGNSKIGDRFLFAGQMTTANTVPFEKPTPPDLEVQYNGDEKNIDREINAGVSMSINSNGAEVFEKAIDTLTAVEEAIDGNTGIDIGDVQGIASIQEGIARVEDVLNTNLQERAEIGAKINRLDLTINRLGDEQNQAKELLSKNEDIDIAEAITNLKMQESVYRASLSIGARVIQPSLVDFVK